MLGRRVGTMIRRTLTRVKILISMPIRKKEATRKATTVTLVVVGVAVAPDLPALVVMTLVPFVLVLALLVVTIVLVLVVVASPEIVLLLIVVIVVHRGDHTLVLVVQRGIALVIHVRTMIVEPCLEVALSDDHCRS
jgi:hypothetical protein